MVMDAGGTQTQKKAARCLGGNFRGSCDTKERGSAPRVYIPSSIFQAQFSNFQVTPQPWLCMWYVPEEASLEIITKTGLNLSNRKRFGQSLCQDHSED